PSHNSSTAARVHAARGVPARLEIRGFAPLTHQAVRFESVVPLRQQNVARTQPLRLRRAHLDILAVADRRPHALPAGAEADGESLREQIIRQRGEQGGIPQLCRGSRRFPRPAISKLAHCLRTPGRLSRPARIEKRCTAFPPPRLQRIAARTPVPPHRGTAGSCVPEVPPQRAPARAPRTHSAERVPGSRRRKAGRPSAMPAAPRRATVSRASGCGPVPRIRDRGEESPDRRSEFARRPLPATTAPACFCPPPNAPRTAARGLARPPRRRHAPPLPRPAPAGGSPATRRADIRADRRQACGRTRGVKAAHGRAGSCRRGSPPCTARRLWPVIGK